MSEATRRRRILLLCDTWPGHANTIKDHISAFRKFSRHEVRTFNPIGMRNSVALDLNEFDAVAVHYSLILSHDNFVSEGFREKLKRYKGLKIQFIQDEYRWVDRVTAASREAGINVLFTLVSEPAASEIYDSRLPAVRRVYTQTGYVPENLLQRPRRPLRERKIEVGYRGRELPFWIGRLSQEKVLVGRGFLERAPDYGLKVDIAWREEDRIYGGAWIDFISSCRATLGSESGASITDFDGSAERAVKNYLVRHPAATFEEVHHAVLRPFEGNVLMNVISPRVFEAAALGTALVMFPGHYSGIVEPEEHYIVLEKDFSNIDEVVVKLRDDDYITALTDRARMHLIDSGRWGFNAFIDQFDDVVDQETKLTPAPRIGSCLPFARAERLVRVPPPNVRIVRAMLDIVSAATGREFARRREIESGALLVKAAVALRAAVGEANLRPMFWEGRRARMSLARLLEELLDLYVLMCAVQGKSVFRETFTVTSQFDTAEGALRFISKAPESPRSNNESKSRGHQAEIDGAINMIEWDHSAVGGIVTLKRPEIRVGIGRDGLKRYDMLVEIGRRRPDLLRRALSYLIEMNDSGVAVTPEVHVIAPAGKDSP